MKLKKEIFSSERRDGNGVDDSVGTHVSQAVRAHVAKKAARKSDSSSPFRSELKSIFKSARTVALPEGMENLSVTVPSEWFGVLDQFVGRERRPVIFRSRNDLLRRVILSGVETICQDSARRMAKELLKRKLNITCALLSAALVAGQLLGGGMMLARRQGRRLYQTMAVRVVRKAEIAAG